MSALTSRLGSRRARTWLPVASVLVLLAGIITFVIVYNVGGLRNTGKSQATPITNKPAQVYKEPKRVPLEAGVREVAGKFILSAVNRSNLRSSWALVSPELKQGFTLKTWMKGDIPVVPYPAVSLASYKVDYSHPNDALLEVMLFPPKSSKLGAQVFFIGLKAYGSGKDK